MFPFSLSPSLRSSFGATFSSSSSMTTTTKMNRSRRRTKKKGNTSRCFFLSERRRVSSCSSPDTPGEKKRKISFFPHGGRDAFKKATAKVVHSRSPLKEIQNRASSCLSSRREGESFGTRRLSSSGEIESSERAA